MSDYLFYCGKCNSLVADTYENDEILCEKCGSIMSPLHINEDEWNSMSSDEKISLLQQYRIPKMQSQSNRSVSSPSANRIKVTREKSQSSSTSTHDSYSHNNRPSNNNKRLKISLIIVSSLLILLIIAVVVTTIIMKKGDELSTVSQNTSTNSTSEQLQEGSPLTNIKNSSDETSENIVQPSNDNSQDTAKSMDDEFKFTHIKYGETIEAGYAQITADKASTTQELRPSDTSSVYSYIEDQSGETFFYLTGTIKNIGTEAFDAENMVIQFIFDDKYEYYGEVLIDDGGNGFYHSTLNPFESDKFYFIASIPDELINSYSKCVIRFAYKNDFNTAGRYTDFDDCDNFFDITIKKD